MLNVSYVWERDWFHLTYSFRTLLLFIMLWLVSYLIHYWVNVNSNLFSFFMMTILFLAVLDTFTPYDAKNSIIRVTVLGFLTMGLVHFYRFVPLEKILLPTRLFMKWLIPLVCLLVLSTSVGLVAPKLNPQWPDPVPYLQSFSQHAVDRRGAVNKVGYDEDDTKLGGSIRSDSSVVFYNTADVSHYWKVESKDIYTGKGWISYTGESLTFPNGEEWTGIENDKAYKRLTNEYEVDVTVIDDNHPILYPADSLVKKVNAEGVKSFRYETNLLKITPIADQQSVESYTVTYEQPRYDIAELRKVNAPNDTMNELMMKSTYLPADVPERVHNLAIELTEGKDNWYDKVKAIENYFDRDEFVYAKENILYPSENQDYVDHFLFETKMGYCDNFSTSMVVLLRAAGIPARWAKGYTDGERTIHEGESVYKVTNDNAHSWVEVYFSGIGWVSFEPTKGFSGNAEFFDSEAEVASSQSNTPEQRQEMKQETMNQENILESEQKMKENPFKAAFSLKWIGVGLLLIGGVAFSLYSTRKKWLPLVLIARYKRKQSSFVEAYQVLNKQLSRAGLPRKEGQTLSDYAAYIDLVYETHHMTELTHRYEMIIYRGDAEGDAWETYCDCWIFLMKRSGKR